MRGIRGPVWYPEGMSEKPPKKKHAWLDYALLVAVGGFLLYRFVVPVPSASLSPELATARLETAGKPMMVEFTSNR